MVHVVGPALRISALLPTVEGREGGGREGGREGREGGGREGRGEERREKEEEVNTHVSGLINCFK